jgi:uncharacterized membrane protein YdfJ with MMPL/SSD domain
MTRLARLVARRRWYVIATWIALTDATVIRALLVPAIMRLMGRWNWWMPPRVAQALRTKPSPLPDAT